jgi:shikimate 5-dehydrogenase
MNIEQAIKNKTKDKLFVSLASRPGKTGSLFYNSLFEFYKIDAEYIPCYCEDLDKDLNLARNHCDGVSITMPFKQKVVEYLDDNSISLTSANTIQIIDKKLIGYNCDLMGLYKLLFPITSTKVVNLLGDGAMAKNIKSFSVVNQYSRNLNNWQDRHSKCDILINATSIGMIEKECPVKDINSKIVVDCVIGNTELIRKSNKKNCLTIKGLDIYKSQLVEQFKIYTGIDPDMKKIDQIAAEISL